jgi:hypothetical protein
MARRQIELVNVADGSSYVFWDDGIDTEFEPNQQRQALLRRATAIHEGSGKRLWVIKEEDKGTVIGIRQFPPISFNVLDAEYSALISKNMTTRSRREEESRLRIAGSHPGMYYSPGMGKDAVEMERKQAIEAQAAGQQVKSAGRRGRPKAAPKADAGVEA